MIDKRFRHAVLDKPSNDYSIGYYQQISGHSLMISRIFIDGGALLTKESGEMIQFESPEYSFDPIERQSTPEESIKEILEYIASEGYEEIPYEKFMELVNERYPDWEVEQPHKPKYWTKKGT